MMPTPCAACREILPVTAKFCGTCGAPVTATIPPMPMPAPAVSPAAAAPQWWGNAEQHEATVTVGTGATLRLASLGRRSAARAIDTAIVAAVCGLILLIGGITASATTTPRASDYSYYGYTSSEPVFGAGAMLAAIILAGLFACAYEIVAVALWGRTTGKAALGLTISDRRTGRKPTFGGAALRWIAPGIGSLIPLLAPVGALVVYLSPVFDTTGTRQGWHDRLASTVVTLR